MVQQPNTLPSAEDLVQSAIRSVQSADRLMKAAIAYSFDPAVIRTKTPRQLAQDTRLLRRSIRPNQLTHNVLRRVERNGLSIQNSVSFATQMHEMSEARRLGTLRPSWKLDVKNNAYSFVDALGVRRPHSDRAAHEWDQISFEFPSVVKATRATGSRGCYLLYSPDRIVHVRDGRVFDSVDALSKHAQNLMSRGSNRLPDRWMVEELILEDSEVHRPARDLKFYSFYGEIALVRESRRDGELKVAYWDRESNPIVTGRYEDVWFEGVGFSKEDAALVSEISRSIPHPFMRIDMLKGEDELVFGEFTPRPGSFDEFNSKWDRLLGEAWVRAESRLLEDLLRGKRFGAFLDSTNLLEARE